MLSSAGSADRGNNRGSPMNALLTKITDMKTTPHLESNSPSNVSRRQFLKNSSFAMAGAAAITELPFVTTSRAAPDDPIRVGVIGCGGRGTGAVLNVLGAATNVIYPDAGYHTEDVKAGTKAERKDVTIVALADLFPDRS